MRSFFFFVCTFVSLNAFSQVMPTVVINEFMAINDSLGTIVDPLGQTEDWVELFNNSSSTINLSNWHLSDSLPNPTYYTFPVGVSIAANGFLIAWCDEDSTQEGLHVSFRLGGNGEDILIADAGGTIIDSYTFGQQQINKSAARQPNGTGSFVIGQPTFNTFNSPVSSQDLAIELPVFATHNNGIARLHITQEIGESRVFVYSADGRLQAGQPISGNAETVELGGFFGVSGIYIIKVATKTGFKTLRLVVGS
jgi:Lamin Tail Domain